MQKKSFAILYRLGAFFGLLLFAQSAFAQPMDTGAQGLYSATNLIGAPVYAADETENSEGVVTDILLDEQMQLAGLLVLLKTEDQPRFIDNAGFAVATSAGDSVNTLSYVVFLGEDIAVIKAREPVDDDWWQTARDAAGEGWEATRDSAKSAWQDSKQGAANLLEQSRDATGEFIDNLRERFE